MAIADPCLYSTLEGSFKKCQVQKLGAEL